jgi:hypothetical protein
LVEGLPLAAVNYWVGKNFPLKMEAVHSGMLVPACQPTTYNSEFNNTNFPAFVKLEGSSFTPQNSLLDPP